MSPKLKLALGAVGVAIATFAMCVLAPLRPTSGDTLGGRLGGLALRCDGDTDVSRIDWIRERAAVKRFYYWVMPDRTGQLVSVFGPAPAVVGAVAVLDVSRGDTISDDTLRRRERYASGFLIALAALLLVLAASARVGVAAASAAGLVAAGSFAGAATLGQGLWQASVALPFLIAGLATLAWRPKKPRLAYLTPGLLLVAVLVRPSIAPLAVGLGIGWALETRDRKLWIGAAAIALAMALPWLVWNTVHLGTPFPSGQWHANKKMSEDTHVFELSLGHIGYALGGLLVSPGRGLLWYAPVVLFGTATAIRSKDRLERTTAICVIAQIGLITLFYRWWGGYAFGPRLLGETVWLCAWLVFVRPPQLRVLRAAAIAVTLIIGQLGLWHFRGEQWEDRRMPDIDENALWDFVDSPLTAMFVGENGLAGVDSMPVQGYRCEQDGRITSLGSTDHGPPK
jgi:hypothetical protein